MLGGIFGRREDEKRVKAEGRLPPGQSLTNRFPVLHYGPVPQTDLAAWDLRIFGEVEEEKRFTWEAFNQLPRTAMTIDLHCVTRWSKFDTAWEGVHVRTLIDQGFITLKPTAKFVIQHCEYGYTTNTPLSVVLADNFLLATHYDGQPLTAEHGWPLRAVIGAIPGADDTSKELYLWKGGKWLRGLEFSATDRLGFWENAGYSNSANVWGEERFSYGW